MMCQVKQGVTDMPGPGPQLTAELREKLDTAVRLAREAYEARTLADVAAERAWEAILAARVPGISDDALCVVPGFTRSSLNRRYGPRSTAHGDPGE
jgi:hypothetical protein